MKLAFVILNYGTYQETIECVQSIKEHIDIDKNEYNITIVDNGSLDDSGDRLNNLYLNDSCIDYISTGENLGFAKGNNVGISHVNEKYSPDFVVVLNSDIELIQDDFYKKVSDEYANSEFGVLGPMMLTSDARCDDSPWEPIEKQQVEKKLNELKRERKRILNGTIYLTKIIHSIKKRLGLYTWKDQLHVHKEFWKYNTNVELQGAFLIFSKRVFDFIEGFDPRTFLYYEEQLLYLRVSRCGLPIVYDPRICVYHKDGRSSRKIMGTSRDKMLFFNKCNIESLEIVLDELNKIEKSK